MAINPYTLNNLYNQGVLDYVPYDLAGNATLSAMNGMQNPYLNAAKQGALYQNHGNAQDSFTLSNTTNSGVNAFGLEGIGSESNAGGVNAFGLGGIGSQGNAGVNAFGLGGIGSQGNAGVNAFGLEGIGSEGNPGLNSFGIEGIGANSPSEANAWGGFGDVNNNISEGVRNTTSAFNKIPGFIKGIAAGTIMIGTVVMMCKKGRKKAAAKAVSENTGSKLNPLNWFKKKNK